MILKAQKRKLPPLDGDSPAPGAPAALAGAVWESQQQFLFSVSLHKYERSRALAEPSLRRCVLLANTLRQASLEAAAPPPMPPGPVANVAVAMATEDDDWGAADSSDFSLSAAISSILTALDVALDAPPPPAPPRTPLRAVENLPAARAPPAAGGWAPQGEGARPGVGASAEDLIQDIDMALLERDGGALGLRGGVAMAAAAGGDELLRFLPTLCPPPLKCLPSFSSFSPLASSSSSSAQSPGRDGFDLDHLMEILVES